MQAIKLSELEVQFVMEGLETIKKCTTLIEATDLLQDLKIYHPETITIKLRFYKIEDLPGQTEV